MAVSTVHLELELEGGADATTQDLVNLVQTLRDDLLELDVESVNSAEKETLKGSKVGLAIDWTTLFVTFAASGGVLTAVISAVQAWLIRHQASTVTLKLGDDELVISGAGPYSDAQEQAIQIWLNRHKGFVT